MTGIVLFTRDLRVHDQPALAAAVRECREVVPLFVFDDRLLAGSCGTANRVSFLLDSLRDLDASLRRRGGRLIVRRGDPVQHVVALAHQTGAHRVYMSADASAYAARREQRLLAGCAEPRIELRTFEAHNVVPPGDLVPVGGDHYRVFTPYWRRWSVAERRELEPAPRTVRVPDRVKAGRMPSAGRLVRLAPSPVPSILAPGVRSPELAAGGETEGRRRLTAWLRSGVDLYDQAHDVLAADRTSRLSPFLHFGCLSVNEVRSRVEQRGEQRGGAGNSPEGAQAYVRQLCWRDFHHQVLAARPDLPTTDYRPRRKRWRHDEALAQAWREGRTGLPIVDAGMRQLAREGFMHNRARMIVASYLTKTLGLDWRIGAAHFAQLLVDCDLACNVGNWQWMAGTGNDTRPNRVLNPLRQAHRFDPDGDYVRRYVPEPAR